MNTNDILEKVGLTEGELTKAEEATLERWMGVLAQRMTTVSGIKEYLEEMRDVVEKELIDTPEFNYIFIFRVINRKQILLKARLNNYLLLLAFISSPDKAKAAMERALVGMVRGKK